jgi:hypothetical protein
MGQVTESLIRAELGEKDFYKGKAYQREARVQNLLVSRDKTEIEARVKGRKRRAYRLSIKLSQGKGTQIHGEYSCPMGYNCKHVAAVLLEALALGHYPNFKLPEESSPLPLEDIVASQKPAEPLFQNWLKNLGPSLPIVAAAEIAASRCLDLLYFLSPKISGSHVQLTIRLVMAKVLKRGGYGSAKPFSSSSDAHFAALTANDHGLVNRLQVLYRQTQQRQASVDQDYSLSDDRDTAILPDLLQTRRCFWLNQANPLKLGPSVSADLRWQLGPSGEQKLSCFLRNKAVLVLPLLPLCYLDLERGLCGPLHTDLEPSRVQSLLQAPALSVAELKTIAVIFKQEAAAWAGLPAPQVLPIQAVEARSPKPQLCLWGEPRLEPPTYFSRAQLQSSILPLGRVTFLYGDSPVAIQDLAVVHRYDAKQGVLQEIKRDLSAEKSYLDSLTKLGAHVAYRVLPSQAAAGLEAFDFLVAEPENEARQQHFLTEALPQLRQQGWNILIDKSFPLQLITELEDWYSDVQPHSDYDWFNMELGFVLEDKKINILPFLVKLLESNPHCLSKEPELKQKSGAYILTLASGEQVNIPIAKIKGILSVLTELFDPQSLNKNGSLAVSRYRSLELFELQALFPSEQSRLWAGKNLSLLSEKLKDFKDFKGIEAVKIPKIFKGEMRDYQQVGSNWLNFLREYQLNGILADDMGLGKTVQTLALLALEKAANRLDLPSLIIAPTSVIGNWLQEIKQFTPTLRVKVLQGQHRQAAFANMAKADILLSTYPLLLRDQAVLLAQPYHYIILDEAQCIKNSSSKAYQILRQLQGRHRLCLTGTPIENHLGELWSLFNFLSPGLLGASKQFTRVFRTPIEKHQDSLRRDSLQRRIQPYILRRSKEQVLQELPPKTEIIRKIELQGEQLNLYESIRLAMQVKVQQTIQA